MKQVMIDIETLSTNKHAAILSVGVAVFATEGAAAGQIIDTNGWAVDMNAIGGGHIDPGTLAWWMKQDESARQFSFGGTHHPISIASELRPYIADADEVWANDPDFDLVILQHWWERMERLNAWPVSFRKYRSVRTMTAMAKRYYVETSHVWQGKTAHNPIEDACGQARAVMAVFEALDRRHSEMLR
jgi:3'-5' exoribonuclease Rv2179c-like domain